MNITFYCSEITVIELRNILSMLVGIPPYNDYLYYFYMPRKKQKTKPKEYLELRWFFIIEYLGPDCVHSYKPL